MIRLLLAETQPMLRRGLSAVLVDPAVAVDAAIDVVAEATAITDVHRHVNAGTVDVVLMDERLGGEDILGLVRTLARRRDHVRVVVLSGEPSDARMLAFLRAGAAGYVSKRSDVSVVYHAVLAASSGGTFIDPALAGRLVTLAARGTRVRGPHGLTVQEMRVLGLLADDLTNREIGASLGISPETVKSHLSSALDKIGASDRVEGAEIVRREGLG